MYFFCDFMVYGALFVSGFHCGYYRKYTFIYSNLWISWFAVSGVGVGLILATGWTLRKYKKNKYLYDNFYIVFYGLICSIISAVFLTTENTDISFYFIFISMIAIYLPCYNYISLRCCSNASRPARISFGNTCYYTGLTTGFAVFNDLEAKRSAWILFGISTFAVVCLIINEVLQQYGIQDYKSSFDLVFNLLNEEKLIYAPRNAVVTQFLGRDDYCFKRNIQWLVVGVAYVAVMERCSFYSLTYQSLTQRATIGYIYTNCHYLPYILYAIGCAFGSVLMLRYKSKLIYLMFGMIKITIIVAVLAIYNEDFPEHCFILMCCFYISMGIYSSISIQVLVECSPFLYTELFLAVSYALELILMEISKLEILNKIENDRKQLLSLGVIMVCITICSICLIQFFVIDSAGLIEMRNRLLGIHRLPIKFYENKLYKQNFFLQMEMPVKASTVVLENKKMFHKQTAEGESKQNK